MRIDELKKIAKENDYKLEKLNDRKEIILTRRVSIDGFLANFITISLDFENQIWIKNINCSKKDLNMIKAAIEFAETPPEDREVEKKFLIQHKYLVSKAFYPVCMVWHKLKDVYRPINCRVDNHIYKAQFTLKEIEEIKIKLDTDLKDFELVEVEE